MPGLTVVEARKMGYEAKGLLARGIDPAEKRRGVLEDVAVARHFEEYIEYEPDGDRDDALRPGTGPRLPSDAADMDVPLH